MLLSILSSAVDTFLLAETRTNEAGDVTAFCCFSSTQTDVVTVRTLTFNDARRVHVLQIA